MSSHASFKKHKEEVEAATFNLQPSNRLCYWCVEEVCLKKRVKKYVRGNLPFRKIGNYATYRAELDKATKSMCPRYMEITTKKTNWQGVDTEIKRKLMAYVKRTPFEIIMESKGHRRRVDGMTYMTISNLVCYWCLSEECLHIRKFHTSPG